MGLGSSSQLLRELHTRSLEKENVVDPDDGNSWSCSACTLPIFSTPFKSHNTNTAVDGGSGHQFFLHDQCANNLPKKLIGHALHPQQPLILKKNQTPTINSSSCDNCKRKCGSKYYQCPDDKCVRLDLLCALPIKILHRSHQHRLMVIKSSAPFFCGACGTQHLGSSAHLSYFCHLCDFWIHHDCASLPNAIILLHPTKRHQHSLFLTYNFPRPHGSAASSSQAYTCAICGDAVQSLGVYLCVKCHYYAHIKCATSSPSRFNPVLIREAKLAGLLHFPMADEYTSVMRTIMENAASSSDEVDPRDEHRQSEDKLFQERLHPHPLSFHGEDDAFDGGDHPGNSPRVCNACVLFISTPFYSCTQCPNFFLHDICAYLPSEINHTTHPEHTLLLFQRAPKSNALSGLFFCYGCSEKCNGFSYSCNSCGFTMDVVCALLPPSITHESHGKTHIMYRTRTAQTGKYKCNCCDSGLLGNFYKCSNCIQFQLDARCVLLPSTIKHKFDEHLLKLTTKPRRSVATDDDLRVYSGKVEQFCEICEKDIALSQWSYSCSQCDQSFHIHCISEGYHDSRIKLGLRIYVNCHDCPLTLISESSIYGYRCGFCLKAFNYGPFPKPKPAYECSKCYFRIHHDCAEKCLSKS